MNSNAPNVQGAAGQAEDDIRATYREGEVGVGLNVFVPSEENTCHANCGSRSPA